MRMINDTNEKLLKMKETLIKVTRDKLKLFPNSSEITEELKKCISEYLKIATEVEKSYFEELVNRIKAYNNTITKEEEYKLLESLEEDYEELEIFQNKIKDICEEYQSVELSDLNIIDIETIRNRKNNIFSYLLNEDKLVKLKEEISTKEQELFNQNKKYSQNKNVITNLENDLIKRFLNSEGRMVDLDNQIIPSSIIEEYKNIDLDITTISENMDLLNQKIITAESICEEKKATKEATETCNYINPTFETKDILKEVTKEYTIANYTLCLLKIANLIFTKVDKYSKAKTKREELIDLINYRNKYLKEMGIIYFVDHMNGLKLDEELIKLDKIEDNTREGIRINRRLKEIEDTIKEIQESNREYLKLINEELIILKPVSLNSISSSLDIPSSSKEYSFNQITNIKELSNNFNNSHVTEKTRNVIKRVYNSIQPKEEEKFKEEVPELVINSVINEEPSIPSEEEMFNDETEEIFKEKVETTVEEVSTKPIIMDDIFETVSPFEDIELFDDKQDDEIVESEESEKTSESVETTDLTEEMPDIFWEVPEEVNEERKAKENFELEMSNLPFLEKNKDKIKKLTI